MLLRSSSTPILGSLISSISDSPNHHLHHQTTPEIFHHHPTTKHFPPHSTIPHSLNKLSFHQSSQHLNISCNSSPISPAVSEFSNGTRCSSIGFRRAQSEGNLEGLANASSNNVDEFSISKPMNKFPGRSTGGLLETIPSFSFHSSTGRYESEDEDDEYEEEEEEEEIMGNGYQLIKNTSRSDLEKSFGFNQEMSYVNAYANIGFQSDSNAQMYLARGLGITATDSSFGGGDGIYDGRGGCGGGSGAGDGQEKDLEEHHKKMVQENPANSLFLRNYAKFLYETKQDLKGAEEYYSRAILIDPTDGDILSQYAKLVWELHRDVDRATGYFERAVQAASEDSHVHAAYASFLWETEDEEEEGDELNGYQVLQPLVHNGVMASAPA